MKIVALLLIVMAAGAQARNMDYDEAKSLGYTQQWYYIWWKLYADSSHQKTWREAMDICHENKGILATPFSSYLRDKMNKFLAKNGVNEVWIGLNDRVKEGSFYYASNSEDAKKGPYGDGWKVGEPNNVNNEDCVIHQGNNGKYHPFLDVNCNSKRRFVCQYVGTD